MTNLAICLPSLLLHCCCKGLILGLLTRTADNWVDDGKAQLHGRPDATTVNRPPCKPVDGSYASCYDVVVPVFQTSLAGPDAELPVTMTALGRRFRLRLRVDPLLGEADGSKMAWSSVLSPSVVVRVLGDNDTHEFRSNDADIGIMWYVGHDDLEVAPSSVLASVVNVDGERLLRAVINTTSGVFHVEPASKAEGVGRNATIVYRRSDVTRNVTLGAGQGPASRCDIRPKPKPHSRRPEKFTWAEEKPIRDSVCTLGIVVDHTFVHGVADGSWKLAVAAAVQYITEADFIFRSTDIDDDGSPDNIGFRISSDITVYSSPNARDYRFSDTTLKLHDLMNIVCSYNYDEYCLVVAFVFRELGGGVLGVAYVPDASSGQGGGICSRHGFYYGGQSMPSGSYSLNVALVTQRLHGWRQSDATASITVTHEIGHAFGAPHDDDLTNRADCNPGGSPHGNYIMAMMMNDLTHVHNFMFSRCSTEAMQRVLSYKSDCLISQRSPHCGNAVVERGEQCDCGTSYECEQLDRCCTPHQLHPHASSSKQCRLRGGAACSPRVSRCCTANCRVANAGVTCRERTDCTEASHCDGRSSSCPAPQLAADGAPCARNAGQCKAGRCSTSLCEQAGLGLVDCLCRRPRNHACSVCCRCENATSEACVPAQWLLIAPASNSMLLLPGAQCLELGKCNSDGRCV